VDQSCRPVPPVVVMGTEIGRLYIWCCQKKFSFGESPPASDAPKITLLETTIALGDRLGSVLPSRHPPVPEGRHARRRRRRHRPHDLRGCRR